MHMSIHSIHELQAQFLDKIKIPVNCSVDRVNQHGGLVGIGDVGEEVGVRGALLLEQLPEEQPPVRAGPGAVRRRHRERRH